MSAFEEKIKNQLLEYLALLHEAEEAKNGFTASIIKRELNAYMLGLKTCLSENYVETFRDYVAGYYDDFERRTNP